MPFAQANDTRIHYQLTGPANAPVLVFLNSLGTDLRLWNNIAATLPHLRILQYDTRGHGRSEVTPGEYTIELLGRDLLALLDVLSIQQAFLCGLSLGGFIAQWLAINSGNRFSGIVLANTAARLGSTESWNTRIAEVRQGGMAAIAEGTLGRWLTLPFRTQHPDETDFIRQMLLATPADGYIACCAAIREMDFRSQLSRIASPTLVIAGAEDPVTTLPDAEFLQDEIPAAQLVTLPSAHLSAIEASAAFAAALAHFLPTGDSPRP